MREDKFGYEKELTMTEIQEFKSEDNKESEMK